MTNINFVFTKVQLQIHNQRTQTPITAKFHDNMNNFKIYIRVESAIWNFETLTSDSSKTIISNKTQIG